MVDKLSIEVGEADEQLDVLHGFRNWPFHDTVNFCLIHGTYTWLEDHTEELNFNDIEITLFGFQVEVMILHPVEYVHNELLCQHCRSGNHPCR